ncbi:hypothetical protein ACH5RR_024761 [Cinchona calisaya]|uniref:Uncharacterized protein n=1 Tax=Cinchona calisaya TaxID=153742 RepID=A0ABD2YYS9_9GENT
MAMALRSSSYLKSRVSRIRGTSNCTTSTGPKLTPFAPTLDYLSQHQDIKARAKRGDFVPMFVAIGMIALSTSFGIYTATKELRNAPSVYVKKSRRETLPEVVEPEHVLEESEKFIKNSFFRKIAHIKDKTREQVILDPTRKDILSRPLRAETVKDIGVDPIPH